MNWMTARLATLMTLALIALPQVSAAASSVTVPYSTYKTWSKEKQVKYFRALRAAAAELERAVNKDVEFSAQIERFQFEFPSLLPEANAAGTGRYCLMGGVRRVMKPRASDGKLVCKADGRGTEVGCQAGEFKCGSIYNDACVKISADITGDCERAAGDSLPSQEFYNSRIENMEKIAASCQNGDIDSRFSEQCGKFTRRLATIKQAFSNGSPVTVDQGGEVEKDGGGVPPIENFGGTNEPVPADPSDEKGEKTTDVVIRPEQPVQPPVEVVTPQEPPPRTDNCMERNRTKLGDLACIACGMEEWNPADVLTAGGGVTKWVALIGTMAQTYHGPYNPGNTESRDAYLGRVAEMISAYGYCTDNEYKPMSMPNETRDWLDGDVSLRERGPSQFTFASGFGIMSNKRGGLFTNNVENASRPMTYAKQIFDVGRSWTRMNPQHHQWRFRSMIKAHYRSYPGTAFSNCAQAAEARMKNLGSLKMCPLREEPGFMGGTRIVHSRKMAPEEFGQNERFYSKLVRRCNVKVRRVVPNLNCDNECKSSQAHTRAVAEMPYCKKGPDPECGSCGEDRGEPETPRDGGTDGGTDGGKDGEGSGNRDGSSSDGSGTDGGKDGEGESTR